MYMHTSVHAPQSRSDSRPGYILPPGETVWGNLKDLFLTEDDYIYLCDPARHWGFSVVLCVFPGDCVGKWTKQQSRALWLLRRQRQPLVWHGRGEPTLLAPSGIQSSFIKTGRRVPCQCRGHPLRALEALESLWMLSQAGCGPRELFCHKKRAAYSLWDRISRGGESQMTRVSGLLGYSPSGCSSLLILSFATQGWWPGTLGARQSALPVALVLPGVAWCRRALSRAHGAGAPGVLNLAPDTSSCSLSTALASVSCMFNGPALWKDEIYGWAIKEKLQRKIYNFPLKPVIHVINIDVI